MANIYKDLVFLDTETTGLNFDTNENTDRLIELAAIKISSIPGEKCPYFYTYCNPEGKKIDKEAYKTHRISDDMLTDVPKFIQIVDSFLEFIDGKTLVIHNARFDLSVLNSELKRIKYPPLENKFIDTLKVSKNLFPNDNKGFKLDDLCDRFNIDKTERDINGHNALLDTKLLAKAYKAILAIQEHKKQIDKISLKF